MVTLELLAGRQQLVHGSGIVGFSWFPVKIDGFVKCMQGVVRE
jgi:hypothetical protein